eukprot:Anaeramoba_ignava/a217886_92.p1 GENE.a217886_92~~a217886_92.p1  ORF type:complete len:421 (-),score=104.33 a217886_92:54-1316(-)
MKFFLIIFLVIFSVTFCQTKDWPFANDGIFNPPTYYERLRLSEAVSTRPFYQWYYYAVSDYDLGVEFAMSIGVSKSSESGSKKNEGVYIMFCLVDPKNDKTFEKFEKYPLDDLSFSHDFDISVDNQKFGIHPITNNSYKIWGTLNDPQHIWYSTGNSSDLDISWSLNIQRIYGWYGQQDIESLAYIWGIIDWNTYSHDSLVSGVVTIGSKQYTLSPNSRIYCDMNWGDYFPVGPTKEFAWGWYKVLLPGKTPAEDVSIIAGSGVTSNLTLFDTMGGYFADVELGKLGKREGYRFLEGWATTPDPVVLLATASNGVFKNFSVERTNWFNYSDDLGQAQIPLTQYVYIASDTLQVSMTFQSTPELYNRLLFPQEDYIFSDFEAFGVTCHIVITSTNGTTKTLIDEVIDDAGLEFGYKIPVHF